MALFGNLFGSSDADNSTKTTTTQTDTSANAGTNSIAQTGSKFVGDSAISTEGGNLSIVSSDPATVEKALNFAGGVAGESLRINRDVTGAALEGMQTVVSLGYQDQANQRAAAAALVGQNSALATELTTRIAVSKKVPNNLTLETGFKYVFYAIAAAAAAWAFSSLFRGGKSNPSTKPAQRKK